MVVDDGSSDNTLQRLIDAFGMVKMDLIYRPHILTQPVRGFYQNPEIPNLLVVTKVNGGKPDALNVGINACRTPYFCTLDSDCILERDALLRLMKPIVHSPVNTVASGGIIRILNGCEVKEGQVVQVGLPESNLERFQVVEYLRSFLFGRTGWNSLHATLIVSGAFAVFHGHAHHGRLEGRTKNHVPVYNVAMKLLQHSLPDHMPFRIIELTGA